MPVVSVVLLILTKEAAPVRASQTRAWLADTAATGLASVPGNLQRVLASRIKAKRGRDIFMRPHNRKMTTRARWYLIIAATRHLLVGGFAILASDSFQSPSFGPMIAAAPLWLWGTMFIGASLACGSGAITRRPRIARLGLMWSASSTLMVGVGLIIAWFTGDLTSPTGPIVWLAIAFKDFTVCADPLRSPFEEWAEEFADGDDAEATRGIA